MVSTRILEAMRNKFSSLLHVATDPADPTNASQLPPSQGQILLALISAPFAQVEVTVMEFVAKMEQLAVPQQWRNVDVIQEAKSLQVKRRLYQTLKLK